MKNMFITVGVFGILSLAVYNSISDKSEMNEHHIFFNKVDGFVEEVRAFMNRGGRNTSKMGYELCVELNETRKLLKQKQINCRERYFNELSLGEQIN